MGRHIVPDLSIAYKEGGKDMRSKVGAILKRIDPSFNPD
jgi:hypothetical protein